jgi:hypothetical protein
MRPKQIKQIIDKVVENPLGSAPIHEWGPPGIGKSAIPKQVAEAKGIGFIDLRGPLLDPTDLRGIPTVWEGKAKWLSPTFLPTEQFCLTCKAPVHNGHTKCPICGGDKFTKQGILFLDELTAAPPLTQAGMYQLTLDRMIGEYHLPDGWYIIAAGNRIEDRAVSYRMPTPLANRFVHLDFEVSLDDWVEWATWEKVNPNIIAFIRFKPDLLFAFKPDSSEKAFPTPRTWHFASKMIHAVPTKLLHETLEGTVGKGASAEFMAFLKVQTELPDLKTIFGGDNFVPKRMDLKYALVAALATRAQGVKQYERMLDYSNHLDTEFAVLLVTMLVAKNEEDMAAAPGFEKWARKNSDVIITRKML